MDEEFVEDLLIDALSDDVANIETFEDCEIMTTNFGVVMTMEDGSEFQITIVRSK